MDSSELREKPVADLEKELVALRKEQFNLRMQMGSGQMDRPHLFKAARRNIARVKTVIAEKQRASEES